jgi:hypothetical protein
VDNKLNKNNKRQKSYKNIHSFENNSNRVAKTNYFLIFGLLMGFILMVFASCHVIINSVVAKDISSKYKDLLIIIPYNNYSDRFVKRLKNELLNNFSKSNVNTYVYILAPQIEELKLNDSKRMLPDSIMNGKDLIMYMIPENTYILNGVIKSFTYKVVGVDPKDTMEIWKSFIDIDCQFGPSPLAKKIAAELFNQLIQDNVIKEKN